MTDSKRRRRSALLSALAAGFTAAVFVWSIAIHSNGSDGPVRVWLIMIALPPVVLSVLAAAQYARTSHTGAGAAATAVYWVLTVLFFVSAGGAFLLGAILQTAAWFICRPRRAANVPQIS
jgi:hypothetical protein